MGWFPTSSDPIALGKPERLKSKTANKKGTLPGGNGPEQVGAPGRIRIDRITIYSSVACSRPNFPYTTLMPTQHTDAKDDQARLPPAVDEDSGKTSRRFGSVTPTST